MAETIYTALFGDIHLSDRVAQKLGPERRDGWPDKRYKTAARDIRYFRYLEHIAEKRAFPEPSEPDLRVYNPTAFRTYEARR